MKPTEPRRRGGPAPLVAGRLKERPEDFVVEEVPAYEPSGEGDHTFLWIEKHGVTTFDAIAAFARELGRRDKDFGYAGLKDAHAVTRQWLSIEHVAEATVRRIEIPGIRLLAVQRHDNKLKLGHLRGNRFSILIRGATAADADAVRANLDELARRGAPNYFGLQRFGRRGRNLEQGISILTGDPRRAARSMPRRVLTLVVSAVQSEIFNRVLAARLDATDTLMPGDVAFLHRNGACFVVEDLATEQPRCAAFELSPTGPLHGPKTLRPTGPAAELEDAALASIGLTVEHFGRMPRGTHEGARRPLRVRVEAPDVAVEPDGIRVAFTLDRGSYATTVLREVMLEAPWPGEEGGAETATDAETDTDPDAEPDA